MFLMCLITEYLNIASLPPEMSTIVINTICSVCQQELLEKKETTPREDKEDKDPQKKKVIEIELKHDLSNWNVDTPSDRITHNTKRIKIRLPKGLYGARGGVNEKFVPRGLKPSNRVELTYQLRVADSFDWVKGGKIGLGILIHGGCGGKDWGTDRKRQRSASFRLMFRRRGQVMAYVYLATDQGRYKEDDLNCPLLKNQGKDFLDAIGHRAPAAGLDVFRFGKKKAYLTPGKWNDITMGATLNSGPETSDGSLFLEVNGTRLETGGIRWTADPESNMFNQLQLPNWMGGGNDSWASPTSQWVKLRNMTYRMHV